MKYINLDDGYKTEGVFLDISKAFDNIWHEGVFDKFKENAANQVSFKIL